MSEAASYDYSVFGLRVRSSIPLPELHATSDGHPPDVIIERGEVPESEPGLSQVDGSLLLVVPEVARYRIDGGSRITIDAAAGVPERNARLFLLGSAFGALMHQRGMLPLHANAVEIDGKAVAFLGKSGAGKSTLAAWFHDRGHRIIADDVCVVRLDDQGKPIAEPGLPRFRLWREALAAFGRDTSDYAPSYSGDETFDKFDVPVTDENRVQTELPLAAIYVLEQGADFSIAPLEGMAAAEAVFANTYRGGFLSDPVHLRAHFEQAVKIIEKVPLFRCQRLWGHEHLDRQAKAIVEEFRARCQDRGVGAQIP